MAGRGDRKRLVALFGVAVVGSVLLFGAGGLLAALAGDAGGGEHPHQIVPRAAVAVLFMINAGLITGFAVPWFFLHREDGLRAVARVILALAGIGTVVTYLAVELI